MRTLVKDDPECPTFLWEREEQIVIQLPVIQEVHPIEIHVKPDGTTDEEPSLCFIFHVEAGMCVSAQISLEKIWPAIEAAIKSKGPLS